MVKKKDLVQALADEYGITKVLSHAIVKTVFETILTCAISGDPYEHPGFGKFVLKELKRRVIHNVNSRELVNLPKRRILRLIPSRRLNQKLNLKSKRRNKK